MLSKNANVTVQTKEMFIDLVTNALLGFNTSDTGITYLKCLYEVCRINGWVKPIKLFIDPFTNAIKVALLKH